MNPVFLQRKLLIAAISALLISGSVGAQVQTETLMKSSSSWDGTPYQSYPDAPPELTVSKITIPPHSALPWHTHPMPNAGYVLSGQLTVEKKQTGQIKTLTAGQVLPEMVGGLHRGMTGDEGAVLIVFYAGTKGMPLAQQQLP